VVEEVKYVRDDPEYLLITGTRVPGERPDAITWIQAWMRSRGRPVIVIGDCPTGVDDEVTKWVLAEHAKGNLEKPIIFYADWKRLRRAAGPERNQRAVNWCRPREWCLGFPGKDSVGTWGCLAMAKAHGMHAIACRNLHL
jgi:hypothetical protein